MGTAFASASSSAKIFGFLANYKVLFLQGGATLQFEMIPMNLFAGTAGEQHVAARTGHLAQQLDLETGLGHEVVDRLEQAAAGGVHAVGHGQVLVERGQRARHVATVGHHVQQDARGGEADGATRHGFLGSHPRRQ